MLSGRPQSQTRARYERPATPLATRRATATLPDNQYPPTANGLIPISGVDAAEIPRIAQALQRHGQRFLDRVYTADEQRYCRERPQRLAGRFAAKEAISKLLGTGIRSIRWRELEILPDPLGKPTVILHGRAAERAASLGLGTISVSITHTGDLALAFAVALGREGTA